ATSDLYPPPLHDALPIYRVVAPAYAAQDREERAPVQVLRRGDAAQREERRQDVDELHGLVDHRRRQVPGLRELQDEGHEQLLERSEEHTSELQSLTNLVC